MVIEQWGSLTSNTYCDTGQPFKMVVQVEKKNHNTYCDTGQPFKMVVQVEKNNNTKTLSL